MNRKIDMDSFDSRMEKLSGEGSRQVQNNGFITEQGDVGRAIWKTLGVFIAVCIIASFFIDSDEEVHKKVIAQRQQLIEKENRQPHNKLGAFTITQDFVESRLKCPQTAKWPWISYSKVTVHLGNGRYQIFSYLDAQNGFGAMVRINFVCVVEHISGDSWRLIGLEM